MRSNRVKDGSNGCIVGTTVYNRMRYQRSTRPIPGSRSALAGDFAQICDPKAPKTADPASITPKFYGFACYVA